MSVGIRKRPVLVTGCGRSGTMYTSRLLSLAGLPCTHERVFTGRRSDIIDLPPGRGESSWFAVPFLDRLPDDCLVIHQVRHPLPVISSYVARGFFKRYAIETPWWKHVAKRALRRPASGTVRHVRMIRETLPHVYAEATEAARGGLFWINWNELVERTCQSLGLECVRIQLERLDEDVLQGILRHAGLDGQCPAREAINQLPRNINTRKRGSDFDWSDLGEVATDVAVTATRYGYDVNPVPASNAVPHR